MDELAVALFIRGVDPSSENYRKADIAKLYSGVKNNLPHLLPKVGLTTRQKRRALREMQIEKPSGMPAKDISMVAFPAEIDPHIRRYGRKLAAALYYKEKRKPVGTDFRIWTRWTLTLNGPDMDRFLEVARISPFQQVGNRTNMNFGDRFGYRYDVNEENHLFTAVAQFGQGMVLAMLVMDGESWDSIEDREWVKVADMFA